jgi:hypothetical protein
MSIHPAIAKQRRRDVIAQADACRLARTARQGRSRRPISQVRTTRRVVITAAAACMAAAGLMLTPAGAGRGQRRRGRLHDRR